MPGPTFGFVKLLASSGSHCTKWADEQHRQAGFESRIVPDLPLPFIPTLLGLRAFDLVSSRVWWEAATNIGFGHLCDFLAFWLGRLAFEPDGRSKPRADSGPNRPPASAGRAAFQIRMQTFYSTRPHGLVQAIFWHTCPDLDLGSWYGLTH